MRTTQTVLKGSAMKAVVKSVLLFSVLFGNGLCTGADWPQFRGPNRDGRAIFEHDLLEVWPEGGPDKLWSLEGLGTGFSTVAVVDGAMYTTGMIDGKGYLFAIDTAGKLKCPAPGFSGVFYVEGNVFRSDVIIYRIVKLCRER